MTSLFFFKGVKLRCLASANANSDSSSLYCYLHHLLLLMHKAHRPSTEIYTPPLQLDTHSIITLAISTPNRLCVHPTCCQEILMSSKCFFIALNHANKEVEFSLTYVISKLGRGYCPICLPLSNCIPHLMFWKHFFFYFCSIFICILWHICLILSIYIIYFYIYFYFLSFIGCYFEPNLHVGTCAERGAFAVRSGPSTGSHVHPCLLARVPLGQLMSNVKSSQALDLLPTTSW